MTIIRIDLLSIPSIKKAEKAKRRLENRGYRLIAEDIGFTTAALFYKKEGKK